MFLLGVLVCLEEWFIYRAIREQAMTDEARAADALVVFGAAQYNGAPSPVFKARLDHAFELEERGIAPIVITTGGSGGDARFTEAGVAHDYLVQEGVASGKIISEGRSESTFESVEAVSRLLNARQARTCVAVSDGFHLYRIKLMFRARGITAFASPDPASPIEADPFKRRLHSLRELFLVTAWHLGYRG